MITMVLLWVMHFVGDFIFQTHWMASNKSKRWDALAAHVAVYSLFFLSLGVKFALVTFVLHFLVDAVTSRATSALWKKAITISHTMTERARDVAKDGDEWLQTVGIDATVVTPDTMRETRHLLERMIGVGSGVETTLVVNAATMHAFFLVIGFDQLLHAVCLAGTYYWLFGPPVI